MQRTLPHQAHRQSAVPGVGNGLVHEADGNADELTLPFDVAGGAQGDDDDAEWREFLALGTPADATAWAGGPDWQHRPVLLSF